MKPDQIVSEVVNLANEAQPGAYDRAYNALQNGYDDFLTNERLCSPTHEVDQQKAQQYWDDINNELNKKGLMPGLSVAWAKANFDRLDTQGRKSHDPVGPDGMLTHSEIRQETGRNQVFARQFDIEQGRRDFFFEVSRLSNNGNTRKVIEHEDIDKYMRKADKTNWKQEKQQNARDAMQPLFDEHGCNNETLLQHLNSLKRNGRVTVREMESFINDCNRTNEPNEIYNQENANYVRDILDGRYPEFERTGDGFNINKLARKGGFDALNMKTATAHSDLEKNYNAANEVAAEKTSPNTTEITPKTKCEEIEEEQAKVKDVQETSNAVDVPANIFEIRKGEGYWHVAKRVLSLDHQTPTNQEIMHAMTVMMGQNAAHFAEKRPGYTPVLHTGDVVHCDLNALAKQVPAAARALGKK